MKYKPHKKHHRRSIRLKGYDYSQAGAYFVTICVHNGQSLLGKIEQNEMKLNASGQLTVQAWHDLPNHYQHVELGAFVTMPNHVHGIIILTNPVGAGLQPAQTNTISQPAQTRAGLKPAPTKRHGLPEIVRAFKTFSARRINKLRGSTGKPFWQRNYYEHIIRNERAFNAIQTYIVNNPINWKDDKLHPTAPSNQFNTHWKSNNQ